MNVLKLGPAKFHVYFSLIKNKAKLTIKRNIKSDRYRFQSLMNFRERNKAEPPLNTHSIRLSIKIIQRRN